VPFSVNPAREAQWLQTLLRPLINAFSHKQVSFYNTPFQAFSWDPSIPRINTRILGTAQPHRDQFAEHVNLDRTC